MNPPVNNNPRPAIKQGLRIPYMRPGTIMGAKKGNLLIAVANAFLGLQIKQGAAADFILSELNSILTIPQADSGGGSGGNGFAWNSSKEFQMANFGVDTGGTYTAGDVVSVLPTNAAAAESALVGIHAAPGYLDPDAGFVVYSRPGTYVCLQACDGTHIPQWPAPAPNDIDDPLNFWWPISELKGHRGTWDVTEFPNGKILGTDTGFATRFADGDVVGFKFQNTSVGNPGVFVVHFTHVGHTINETTVPTVDDIFGAYNGVYSQSVWRGPLFSASNAGFFNLADVIANF